MTAPAAGLGALDGVPLRRPPECDACGAAMVEPIRGQRSPLNLTRYAFVWRITAGTEIGTAE